MRRSVVFGLVTLLCAVAVFAARASSAQALVPPPGPDPGVAGGGYVLTGPNIEANRIRFEFAVRQSQDDGMIRGKSLTIRSFGAFTCALDTFCGTKYVSRSWTSTPYPGIPAAFGGEGSAGMDTCSLYVFTDVVPSGGFHGVAHLFLIDPSGGEHFTGLTFGYSLDVFVGPDASPAGDFIAISGIIGPPLPVPMPVGPLASGNIGVTDGVFSKELKSCPH